MNAVTHNFAADHRLGATQAGLLWCLDPNAMIATPTGQKAASSLRPGEEVLGANGAAGRVQCSTRIILHHDFGQDRRLAWPLQIQAGAFADSMPERTMRLPCNARVATGSVPLACIAQFANDASVTRLAPDAAGLPWQILVCETDPPPLLVANGLAIAGKNLMPYDDLDRALARLATPDIAPTPPFNLPSGSGQAGTRRAMADRALMLGHTQIGDPGLALRAGSRLVAPDCTGAWCRFTLTPNMTAPPHRVTLLSRHAVPAETIGNNEKRRLGVAVSRILANTRSIDLAHWALGAGWHDNEPGWRWTCGGADLLLPPGTRTLRIEIANILPFYPLPQRGDVPGLREEFW